MKAFILLFITFTMLVKPLWPLAEYAINYNYIVNVLCENKKRPAIQCGGTCYLARQLGKRSEMDDKNPFSENYSKIEIATFLYFETLDQIFFEMDFCDATTTNFNTSQMFITTFFPSDISHPPELV